MVLRVQSLFGDERGPSLGQKLREVNWGLVALLTLIACVGFVMQYSAAGGNWEPWASRQILRFGFGVVLLVAVAVIELKFWYRIAYVLYGVGLALLMAVEIMGTVGMGAQRWVDLGIVQLQPSEVMKVALTLVLARYFHGILPEEIGRLRVVVPPLLLVLPPVALVLKQPDLGTAVMLLLSAAAVCFIAGVRIWKFVLAIAATLVALPLTWQYALHDYQRNRVLTFLDPERDPLGTGYHITQSKIALGSGGLFGRGYLQGTQSHLSFLPEHRTDFIFTMLAEELGMVGGICLLGLYLLVLAYGAGIALRSRNQFGRLLAFGVTTTFFIYVFVNIAMVMGMVPVVGIPLPLVSYGGTSMMTLLVAFGLVLCVYVHRDFTFNRRAALAA
ncbi:MAG: rod shape-determining protein RodA [Alphaproteobacteria bacterium]|nr:rod shape-determining protein RodA [Alphaproteobacteria bacterium]